MWLELKNEVYVGQDQVFTLRVKALPSYDLSIKAFVELILLLHLEDLISLPAVIGLLISVLNSIQVLYMQQGI